MRRTRAAIVLPSVIAVAMLTLTSAALAVGPSLPSLDGGGSIDTPGSAVSYTARLAGPATVLEARTHGREIRTATLPGRWGIQLATLDGALTGLSPSGRVLVLGDNVQPTGSLRARSRFAVVDTRALALTRTISLRGDFSVDALSPNGALLYLIHHVSGADATRYQVQAYDLHRGRLLPGVIADKRQAGWIMAGYPVSRTATRSGDWVYTLYRQDDNYPFIHALDTVHHTAVCIGLPANWTTDAAWVSSARLQLDAGTLAVTTRAGESRFLLDTTTFRVRAP